MIFIISYMKVINRGLVLILHGNGATGRYCQTPVLTWYFQLTNYNIVFSLQGTRVLGDLSLTRILWPFAIAFIVSFSFSWGHLTLIIWSCCTTSWCTVPVAFCWPDIWSFWNLFSPSSGMLVAVLIEQIFSHNPSIQIVTVAQLLHLILQQALGTLGGTMKWACLCFSNYKLAKQMGL